VTAANLDRAAFDALVKERVTAIASAAVSRHPAARREGVQEAQLLEAAAAEFADAVDRSGLLNNGQPVPYEEAVVITGTAGVVVVRATDYRREPIYWEARAGEVDGLTIGPLLVAGLRDES